MQAAKLLNCRVVEIYPVVISLHRRGAVALALRPFSLLLKCAKFVASLTLLFRLSDLDLARFDSI